MSKPTFDIRGNLLPHAVTEISSEVLDQWFVESFGAASRRRALIEEYKRYTANLLTVIGRPFYQ